MDCCSERLENAQVTVGDHEDGIRNALCGVVKGASGKNVLEVKCSSNMNERYVSVLRIGTITLCEVKVMGSPSLLQEVEPSGEFLQPFLESKYSVIM